MYEGGGRWRKLRDEMQQTRRQDWDCALREWPFPAHIHSEAKHGIVQLYVERNEREPATLHQRWDAMYLNVAIILA
jgi:hypothetical protein